ncbi:hypothetical protein GCM10023161_42930 [Mycobacterium paraffinicum]|uniref:DUF4307 domain-containing protein n=1 Tax=Mycobacterium paraffinicum TaxID=53378 RepID=A0ABP8F3D3_9MYCO
MSEDTREIDTAADSATPSERSAGGDTRAWRKVKVVPVVLILLLLISGGAAAWLYFNQYRPDKQTDGGVANGVIGAASDGTVALLSYSPDTLEQGLRCREVAPVR